MGNGSPQAVPLPFPLVWFLDSALSGFSRTDDDDPKTSEPTVLLTTSTNFTKGESMDSNEHYTAQYLAADRSQRLLVVAVLFAVLEVIFLALHLTTRINKNAFRGGETYFLVPAFFFCFANSIIAFYGIKYDGMGRHTVTVSEDQLVDFLKMTTAEEYLYQFSTLLPKLSILCVYLRIFTLKPYQYAIYMIGSVLVSAFIAAIFVASFSCIPFRYKYDKSISGHCINEHHAFIWNGFIGIPTDVAMIVLPLCGVWKLRISRCQKLGVMITFLTFNLGLITTTIRFVEFTQNNFFQDPTWYSMNTQIWTIVEGGAYFIAGCLPSLRPLLGPIFKKINLRSLSQYSMRYESNVMSAGEPKTERNNYNVSSRPEKLPQHRFEQLENVSGPCLKHVSDPTDSVNKDHQKIQEIDLERGNPGE